MHYQIWFKQLTVTHPAVWEGIAGCVVHVDVHGECVCCMWMQCICYSAWEVHV